MKEKRGCQIPLPFPHLEEELRTLLAMLLERRMAQGGESSHGGQHRQGKGGRACAETSGGISFRGAVSLSLAERMDKRERTVKELRYILRRLMKSPRALDRQKLHTITPRQCADALQAHFRTPRQYAKGRALLHSIFTFGQRNGWCLGNPVAALPKPRIIEREVIPLPWEQIIDLLRASQRPEFSECMAALGLMLWAGIRPAELSRLSWEDIDREEQVIILRAHHTKTGGCRHVTLYPVLAAWLRRIPLARKGSGMICPRNWSTLWRDLRRAAGITEWQQDVLRHTFASYHLKHWHDLPRLQAEMGHLSLQLLRTRYLSMRGITKHHARLFWSSSFSLSIEPPPKCASPSIGSSASCALHEK